MNQQKPKESCTGKPGKKTTAHNIKTKFELGLLFPPKQLHTKTKSKILLDDPAAFFSASDSFLLALNSARTLDHMRPNVRVDKPCLYGEVGGYS